MPEQVHESSEKIATQEETLANIKNEILLFLKNQEKGADGLEEKGKNKKRITEYVKGLSKSFSLSQEEIDSFLEEYYFSARESIHGEADDISKKIERNLSAKSFREKILREVFVD